MAAWELIIDGTLAGAANMAVDAALLGEVQRSSGARTVVRFYGWRGPTISLGRNQKVENALDVDYCRVSRIDIVHRPTGGRAVLHDDELTYAVISNDSFYFGDTIYGNYRRVSDDLCVGDNHLAISGTLAPHTRKPYVLGNGIGPPCFLSHPLFELMVDGRKIVGSAQRRVRRSFLQHGSMPITCNRDNLARATGLTDSAPLLMEMAGVAEFLPVRPTIEQFRETFIRAFQKYFSIEFRLG